LGQLGRPGQWKSGNSRFTCYQERLAECQFHEPSLPRPPARSLGMATALVEVIPAADCKHGGTRYPVSGCVSIRLHGCPPAMQALVRNALMADVPVQAVDTVDFGAYDGPLESEMVAHRLGGVPIRGLCPLKFHIRVRACAEAPLTWVTSEDIMEDDPAQGRVVRCSRPCGSRFLLVPLLAGQEFAVTCNTALGTGRKHTRWLSTFVGVQPQEDGRPDSARFTVETNGALSPQEAWVRALEATETFFVRIARGNCSPTAGGSPLSPTPTTPTTPLA